ncbi:hypothetical protein [Rhodovulum sp. MB263]|uniref:hypothetical protein n=1 Tax=Rhodovulum sp. (strain MB263) TaxID=308754 RepID=UPI0009B747AE|nr:hypothetical protein [Rhodovulum sp. MB263]ARC88052.1 hypothetical protein B5V46_05225 [Rhodovulum sp. MB263]
MADPSAREKAALERIAILDDPEKLRRFIDNAGRLGAVAVEQAAFRRLCEILPSARRGTVEHDVWRSIHALEEMLKAERGTTVRLSRTRQKISKDGEVKTVMDLVLRATPSEGFQMLIDRGHPELLFEAVVLRHPEAFGDDVRQAANDRLGNAGGAAAALAEG